MSGGADESRASGLESAAILVLKQAVEMDQAGRRLEALTCYREGIGILMDVLRSIPADSSNAKRNSIRERVEEYMGRAEKLKTRVESEKNSGKFHEQFRIGNNDVGYSYERIFRPLIDADLTQVHVDDPYIRLQHQLLNLLRFCEMLVRYARKLKSIVLTTGKDENTESQRNQESALEDMRKSLEARGVRLEVHFSSTLHDREVRFNTGWIVKIGRGLDYFKPVSRYYIGYCDFLLRPCHETIVDIFHKNTLRK